MTQPEYDQKKRECWEEFLQKHEISSADGVTADAFIMAFDRAYALGKQKETITQEEIEKAWQDYAKEIGLPESLNYATKSMIEIAIKQAFKAGTKLNGKQENDVEKKKSPKFKIGDKVRVKYPPYKGLIGEIDSISDRILEYHLSGNESLENVYFAESYFELVQDADTVIKGWVARNGGGPNDLGLHVYSVKPDRMKNRREWNGHGEMSYLIDCRLFPDLTWESDPLQVEIIIKRKKK